MVKICPKCGFEVRGIQEECPRCGIIFSRYRKKNESLDMMESNGNKIEDAGQSCDDEPDNPVMNVLFYVKPKTDSVDFVVRLLFFAVFFIWGLCFIFSSINNTGCGLSFWHMVNLPFHEAGHIIFRPFGRLITSLGGTLGQLLMPLICMGVFLFKNRDTFAAGFCLWWLGENFMDIAPYIDDARSLTMPLLGGNTGETSPYGFHDWEFILTETGLLNYDHVIAWLAHAAGIGLILLAFVWWVIVLRTYYTRME